MRSSTVPGGKDPKTRAFVPIMAVYSLGITGQPKAHDLLVSNYLFQQAGSFVRRRWESTQTESLALRDRGSHKRHAQLANKGHRPNPSAPAPVMVSAPAQMRSR